MVYSEGVQLRRTEIARQHRAAEGDDVVQRQQAQLDHGEITVTADKQRVLLLTFRQPLPVDLLQQAAGTVAAAHRQHNLVGAGQAGEGVDIIQALCLGTGKALLAAGYNRLILYLVALFH